MLRRQIIDYLHRGDVLSGIEDCHLPGINSIVIRERENSIRGMVRVYHATARHTLKHWIDRDTGDFVLMPHSHRQDLLLIPLFGKITHRKFEIGENGYAPIYEYKYDSVILGGTGGLKPVDYVRYRVPGYDVDMSKPHQEVFLRAEEVHSMRVDGEAAWAVVEARLSDVEPSCYSLLSNKVISREGMATRPMDLDELGWRCIKIAEKAVAA